MNKFDEQIKIITSELGNKHYICSICIIMISDRERPEKCFNCDSTSSIPDVIHLPKEWNYPNKSKKNT